MALASLLTKVAGLGILVVFVKYVVAYLGSPLKQIPGPFLAKFTDLWRFLSHYEQTHIETQRKLHAQYGDVVRIGPNTVSIAEPSLIKTIYSTRGTFAKSEYYSVNDALQDDHIIENLFGTRSNEYHARRVKPVQKLYSFQSAYELEPLMYNTLGALCRELEQRFMEGENKGKTCDIADWISYFAWDFLGDMTFSKRLGFMEQGKDVGNMIDTAERVMRYFSVVGQIPTLDKLLGKNPYLPLKFADFSVAAGYCVERFMDRMQNLEQFKDKKDFTNGFIQAKQEYPDLVSDNDIIGYMILNMLGGADTAAIVTKSIFYHILKTPAAKTKLVSELHSSSLSFPCSHATLEALPYLDACIKEGLRMHPVVGHILERVVPSNGLALPGKDMPTLPPGTIVGMNPWVIHYREDVWGESPEEFRPERWLRGDEEAEEVYEARLRKMKDCDMSFGNGNRTCLGRPLALVELYKVTATLFGKYKIELEDPEQEWDLHKQWFVWPHNIKVKMSPY